MKVRIKNVIGSTGNEWLLWELKKKLKTKIIKHAGLVFDANPLRMRLPVMENLKEVTR